MPNARVIKNRIKTVKNTGKITKTMGMVATAKATKVVGVIKKSRPYAEKISQVLASLGVSSDSHALLRTNGSASRNLVVAITANRGLCGGYNANIIRLAKEEVSDHTDVYMYGKKGISAFKYSGIEISDAFTHLGDIPSFDDASQLADRVMSEYENGKYSEIKIVYSKFYSAANQKPTAETILPLSIDQEEGAYGVEPIFAPSKDELLSSLIPKMVRISVYKAMLDAAASEHLARQMAMNSASDNANEMVKALTLSYNRARQAQITTELSEIVGGAEALN